MRRMVAALRRVDADTTLPTGRSYVDGGYVDSTSGETFDAVYPATNRVICAVEQAGDQGQVLVAGGGPDEGAAPGQLQVAARFGAGHARVGGVGQQRAAGGCPAGVGELGDGRLHLAQPRRRGRSLRINLLSALGCTLALGRAS